LTALSFTASSKRLAVSVLQGPAYSRHGYQRVHASFVVLLLTLFRVCATLGPDPTTGQRWLSLTCYAHQHTTGGNDIHTQRPKDNGTHCRQGHTAIELTSWSIQHLLWHEAGALLPQWQLAL